MTRARWLTLLSGCVLGLVLTLWLVPVGRTDDTATRWAPGPIQTDQSTTYAGVLLSDALVYLFNKDTSDGTGKTIRMFESSDFGSTFFQSVSSQQTALAAAMPAFVSGLYVPASGVFLLGGTTTAVGTNALLRGNAFTWAFPTITGSTAVAQTAHSLLTQGNTTLAIFQPTAGGAASVCRSTDGAVTTFTCSVPSPGPGATQPLNANAAAPGTLQGIASPALGTWLILDDSATVFRSVNDGQTWTSISQLTTDTSPMHAILCIDTTTCLAATSSAASTNTRIFLSGDAGLTWTSKFSAARTDRVTTLVNIGQGVVAFLGDPTIASPSPFGYRSADKGMTWRPIASPVIVTPVATATFVTHIAPWVQSTGAVSIPSYYCTAGASCGVGLVRSTIATAGLGTSANPLKTQTRGATTTMALPDVTVNATPILIRGANPNRVVLYCRNIDGTNTIRLGDNTVTSARGYALTANTAIALTGTYPVFGAPVAGTPIITCTEDTQ